MKKDELKKVLKPLIKECIREVIFEDGTLSTIITEVVKGTSQTTIPAKKPPTQIRQDNRKLEEIKRKRKKMLDAIGKDAYNGVDLFEGTTPMKKGGTQDHGPLRDMDPRDPGVDISDLFSPTSSAIWKKLSGK
jgi:hypothetical protein